MRLGWGGGLRGGRGGRARGRRGVRFGVVVRGSVAPPSGGDLGPQLGSGAPEAVVCMRVGRVVLVGEQLGVQAGVEGAGLAAGGEEGGREGVVPRVEGGASAAVGGRGDVGWGVWRWGGGRRWVFGALAVGEAEEGEDELGEGALGGVGGWGGEGWRWWDGEGGVSGKLVVHGGGEGWWVVAGW